MRKYGYIKLPRSINSLPLAARSVMTFLCMESMHCTTEHPTVGEIEAWAMVTSLRKLAQDVGLTIQEARTAITTLSEQKMIAISAASRYTKLTVVWREFLELNGYNIMLNNTISNTISNTTSNTIPTSVTNEDSTAYSDEKKSATQSATQSATRNSINNSINNIHTHNSIVSINLNGRTGAHAHAHVRELQEWMAHNTPELTTHSMPLSVADINRITQCYSLEDIHRLLFIMWSKRAYEKHRSVYAAFRSFADNDIIIKFRKQEDLLSYDEMLAYMHKNNIKQDAFTMIPQPQGKPKWRLNKIA